MVGWDLELRLGLDNDVNRTRIKCILIFKQIVETLKFVKTKQYTMMRRMKIIVLGKYCFKIVLFLVFLKVIVQ